MAQLMDPVRIQYVVVACRGICSMGKVTDISKAPGFSSQATIQPDAQTDGQAMPAMSDDKTRQKRILVVEDDTIIRDLVAELLRLEGYGVESARNGAEALKAIERQRPDVLVLDMRMPTLNGWELASAMKERGI